MEVRQKLSSGVTVLAHCMIAVAVGSASGIIFLILNGIWLGLSWWWVFPIYSCVGALTHLAAAIALSEEERGWWVDLDN